MQEKNHIAKVDYVLFLFTKMMAFGFVAREMDTILGKQATGVTSLCCRWGKIRYSKK